MPTTRETILSALHALLQTQPAPVLRGEVLPERVPAAGLLILRDGDPGEPAVTLSPLRYHYQHRAEVEAVVQTGTGRDAAFDALAAGVGTVLAADRTLGGLCDWAEAEAPRPVDLAVDGAATLKAAVIPIVLHYASATRSADWPAARSVAVRRGAARRRCVASRGSAGSRRTVAAAERRARAASGRAEASRGRRPAVWRGSFRGSATQAIGRRNLRRRPCSSGSMILRDTGAMRPIASNCRCSRDFSSAICALTAF